MTPAKTAAATANNNVPVANMKPTMRAIPRIYRSKPSLAPAGEHSPRQDKLNDCASKARARRTLRGQLTDISPLESGEPTCDFDPCRARLRRMYDRSVSSRSDAISPPRMLCASLNVSPAQGPGRLTTQRRLQTLGGYRVFRARQKMRL